MPLFYRLVLVLTLVSGLAFSVSHGDDTQDKKMALRLKLLEKMEKIKKLKENEGESQATEEATLSFEEACSLVMEQFRKYWPD